MDFQRKYNSLFYEIKFLILQPRKFWTERSAQAFPDKVVVRIFLPLVILAALGVFIGELIHSFEIIWFYAIFKGIRELISYSLQYLIAVPVLAALLRNFGGTPDRKKLRIVIGYTLVPFLIASFITGLFPAMYVVSIAGLYGFYVFITGALTMLEIPVENQSRYVILAILLIILIFGLVNIVCWKLFQALFSYGA
ncbi:MAG: YIP1 family protein [Prolixibacteraceae bacterium]